MSGVVVTGVGLVTSIGVGTGAAWQAMLAGREGVGEIPYFDTTAYKAHRAHVIRDVGLDTTPPERVGMVVGTLGGDLKTFEGALRVDPQHKASGFTGPVARTYPLSTILGALANRLGTGGPHLLSVNACSSGNHALASGCDLIRRGEMDAMIVGGVDVFAQTEFTYFHNLRSLA